MHDPTEGAGVGRHRRRNPRELRTAPAVAIGGAVGAALRWAVGEAIPDGDGWPWGVFVVNIVGCAALGWLVARRAHLSARVFDASTIGFCGALTTFSAFAVDLTTMARDDRLGLFAGYLFASFACGTAAYLTGYRIGRLRRPLVAGS